MPSSSVAMHSSAPCTASRLTSVTMRRCDSMAKESSSSNAASALSICRSNGRLPCSRSQQQPHQQSEYGEQKCGGEKLRRAEHAQFGRHRFDQCDTGAGQHELCSQEQQRDGQDRTAPGWWPAPTG